MRRMALLLTLLLYAGIGAGLVVVTLSVRRFRQGIDSMAARVGMSVGYGRLVWFGGIEIRWVYRYRSLSGTSVSKLGSSVGVDARFVCRIRNPCDDPSLQSAVRSEPPIRCTTRASHTIYDPSLPYDIRPEPPIRYTTRASRPIDQTCIQTSTGGWCPRHFGPAVLWHGVGGGIIIV